ncbi:MAG: ATP-binding cassette domain-containing protein [Comamonas sp.]|jgi:lipopolysaccharide transport system ATP-binding protein|nr:ATP-binding cassette domain-containing protein [Comamonas sp.]
MSSDAPSPVLSFQDAGKTYPPQRTPLRQLWGHLRGSQRLEAGGYSALQPVSFDIHPGQSVGIVGLNGAGKSTLLQLAAGTLTPSSGQVHARGRIAALLELGSGFNPEATGIENIFLYAATMGLTYAQVEARLDSICAFSGLSSDHLAMPVKTYSSGMQVRLAFAVATSVEPDILIVDEALSVGDGVFAKRSFDRVMQLRENGTSLLLCSHALFHVDLFCERCLWLEQGHIREFGPTSAVLPRYQEYLDGVNRQPGVDAVSATIQANALPEQAAPTAPDAPAAPDASSQIPATVARFIQVEVGLDGTIGTELRGYTGSSTLHVNAIVNTSAQEPHPLVAVVISSESGKILGSGHCPPDTVQADNAQGHAHVRYTLPQLPLNKGRYRVGVYLLCQQGRFVYEWMDPIAHIELEHNGQHQGPWLLAGEWRLVADG